MVGTPLFHTIQIGSQRKSLKLYAWRTVDLNGEWWVYGPELPKPHHTHDMVSLGDKVYVIAGGGRRSYEHDYYNTIYEMDSTLKSWRLLKQRLIEPRYWPVAALIPDSATTCTKSKNQDDLNDEVVEK